MGRLDGKVAIVTGASKGIGAEIAVRLAAEGARVAVNFASSQVGAQAVVDRIQAAGGKARAIRGDVAREADAAALVTTTVDAFGGLDILVNNAAYFDFGPIETITTAAFHQHFDVNVLGPLLMSRQALAYLRPGAAIVHIGSAGIDNPGPNALLYAGSKAALEKITTFMARELGPRGIRVNMVRPGATDTEGNRRVGTLDDAAIVDALIAHTALGRVGHPRDVAPAVAFLASDEAAWITGAVLDASGGFA